MRRREPLQLVNTPTPCPACVGCPGLHGTYGTAFSHPLWCTAPHHTTPLSKHPSSKSSSSSSCRCHAMHEQHIHFTSSCFKVLRERTSEMLTRTAHPIYLLFVSEDRTCICTAYLLHVTFFFLNRITILLLHFALGKIEKKKRRKKAEKHLLQRSFITHQRTLHITLSNHSDDHRSDPLWKQKQKKPPEPSLLFVRYKGGRGGSTK